MADIQHRVITKSDAHASFRHLEATVGAYGTAIAGADASLDAEGVLALQSNLRRVQYLSTPGNPGTYTTLYPGFSTNAVAPAVGDDVDDGYEPGHLWIDTVAPALYICVSNAAGAADWNQIDAAGGGGIGPGTDNRLARYDGVNQIQQSGITVSDTDAVTGVASIALGDGTELAPAVAATSATGVGMWWPGANALAFSAGSPGAEAMRLNSTGQMLLTQTGSDSTPEFSFVNDPDTGIRYGTNDIRWVHSGFERFTIDPNRADITGDIGNASIPALSVLNRTVMNASSGTQILQRLRGTYVQSGTAGYTALEFDITESATGSGQQKLISGLVGAVEQFSVTSSGDGFFSGALEIDGDLNHDGANVGFYGVAPVARPAAYTPTNVTADRAYDANATTVAELADVVGTMIADLQAVGLFQ